MTPPSSTNGINLDLILTAITRVENVVTGLDARVRALEGSIISQSITASQKLDAAFARIDEMKVLTNSIQSDLDCKVRERVEVTNKLTERLEAAEKQIISLQGIARVALWIAGVLGLMGITLLWKIFTGEVQIK